MKNKESRRPSTAQSQKSKKSNKSQKSVQKGPTKTQIERLKKFYNTTRWLPNSAFTTYFGKPAFENYGYGNTNPVYGGLFYGNYMLSHNMNPIDGANHPPEKQVYSSAMMKSMQRQAIRRPSPPRKVPDEIRNTPEELEEIKTRAQIFQLPNVCPSREIIPPNLMKSRYFRSGKNTPKNSDDENEDEYEDWNVENVLAGKKNKKKKISKNLGKGFDPYKQGKVQLGKKKMKEGLDNKIDPALAEKVKSKRKKMASGEEEEEYEEMEDEANLEYNTKKRFYEQMLGEDGLKNLEDLKDLNIETKEEEEQKNQELMEQQAALRKQYQEDEEQQQQQQQEQNPQDENLTPCPLCSQTQPMYGASLLKKKENPALYPPNNGFVCCVHHSKEYFSTENKNPRNYGNMPPCMMASVIPAGRPSKKEEPLCLFK